MANTFLISDLHLGHAAILGFKTNAGLPCRTFSSVEEMDETMISRWNSVVRQDDKVYVLGDVAIRLKSLPLLDRCNGNKRLVRGNHDIFPTKEYMKYFKEIYGVRVLEGLILSHIPLHEGSLGGRVNAHGHLHNNQAPEVLGPKYFNVCVENIDYTPVALEDVKKAIANGRMTV